ncbi:IclR family transcriptional regulator [Sphingomonas sp. GB1N7]|uniref:IclR family transcriptional regulator n=1 Tax=Parasphingomonas caseinilytica TaxID=3096158 RepID=UPI002FCC2D25
MRPVELAFKVIEKLSTHQPVGVSELARLMEIPKSTVQRVLVSLQQTGWIEPSAGDRPVWRLTIRALVASGQTSVHHGPLRAIALGVMEDLRRHSEETVLLTRRFQDMLVLVERLDGIRPVRYFFPYGAVSPLHSTATGQAMLAALPAGDLDAYLDHAMMAVTGRTVTDPAMLREVLEKVRTRGFAVNLGGNTADVHAVGAAIIARDGMPIAGVSVSAPAERLHKATASLLGPVVADAARRISLGLAAESTSPLDD